MSTFNPVSDCTGLNLVTRMPECSNYCNSSNGQCDQAITNFCANDETNLIKYPGVCANFMNNSYYQSIIDSLKAQYDGLDINASNTLCWYPLASTAKYYTLSQLNTNNQPCPSVSNCYQQTSVQDQTSKVIGCSQSASTGVKTGNESKPTNQTSIISEITDIYNNNMLYIWFGLATVLFVIVLMLTIVGFKNYSRSSTLNQLVLHSQVQSLEIQQLATILGKNAINSLNETQ